MGNIGGVSSSVEDGQTGADSSDGSGDGTQMGSITFSQDTVGYAGTWVPFEDGFKLYLPNDWDVYELSDEQTKQGVLFAAGDTSGVKRFPLPSDRVGTRWTISFPSTASPAFPTGSRKATAALSCFSIPPTGSTCSA